MKPHRYISVMGTMGSGKTTVAKLLAHALGYPLIEEHFEDNAFLPKFYRNMKRWAFHSQTFFLMEKITQMFELKDLLDTSSIVQDTPIVQDVYSYAKAQHISGHIDASEWTLYQKIYRSFEPYIPKPDVIIYLETSLPNVLKRIEKRGRPYEQHIPKIYLKRLEMLNSEWLRLNTDIPVKRIPTDDIDLATNARDRYQVVQAVRDTLRLLI